MGRLPTYTLRWMTRRDVAQVAAIEGDTFDYPWTAADFRTALKTRGICCIVIEGYRQVLAYAIYDHHDGRLYVLNLVVHYEFRRQGLGRWLVESIQDRVAAMTVYANVTETNVEAQLFFRECGFRVGRITRFAYECTDAAAYQFRWKYNWPRQRRVETEPVADPQGQCVGR